MTIALVCFVVGFSIIGLALQGLQAHRAPTANFVLVQVGIVALVIGDILVWPYEWRLYDWKSESDKYDTTDDY